MSTPPVTVAVADLLTIADPADVIPAESREAPHVRVLLAEAREGSRAAFGELVTLYQRVVFRTALAALGTREDAEDATQDAFIVAWQKLPGFRGNASFQTWLLTIVWRKALDKRRARRLWWRRTQAVIPVDRDPIDLVATGSPDPERTAVSHESARHVREAIGRLSPKLRDTLVLAASGEYSYDEIATILGLPLGTVKWRVAEARRLLKDRLGRAHE
jgi:RNA polymerase sigma-70 factor (ECF subfamily)